MNKFKYLLIAFLSLVLVFTNTSSVIAESDIIFEGNIFTIKKIDNTYIIYNNQTSQTIEANTENDNITELIFSDGSKAEISPKKPIRRAGVPIPKGVDPSKLTYYYLDTTYSNTNEIQNYKSFWIALMGFVPYIGQAVSVIGFIDTVISLNNKKVVYFKTKRYYAKGYMYYKYITYAYKDSARKHLIKKRTDYVKMY